MMLAALLLVALDPLPAAIPNPSFEQGIEGWSAVGHGYLASIFQPNARGPRFLSMNWAAPAPAPAGAEFRVGTRIDARRYRGRRIRISASTQVYGRSDGAVIFADAGAGAAAAPLVRGKGWERRGVDLAIPRRAREIVLGFHIRGAGVRVEADDVRLEVLR